jgi:hypothetical protein
MATMTKVNPLPEPVVFAERGEVDLTPSSRARKLAAVIVGLTVLLYVIFW